MPKTAPTCARQRRPCIFSVANARRTPTRATDGRDMITATGKYNSANIMIDSLDPETLSQIRSFLDHPAFAGTYIAIMPDAHAGAGAVIGFTARRNDYVIPNVVGVDIGCGVLAYPLGSRKIDFASFDHFIKANIPSGFRIRGAGDQLITGDRPKDLFGRGMKSVIDLAGDTGQEVSKVIGSVGTLGGGNHFIEIDRTDEGQFWLLIHSGSRNFGLRVATYFQNKARELRPKTFPGAEATKGLDYLPTGRGAEEYLEAMRIAQSYAKLNRAVMARIILTFFDQSPRDAEAVETVHNYISFEDNIIRKGAVSAHAGERLIIPFNMRDGVMVCRGKGSSKWNYSAPHGAGRILSRSQARKKLSLPEFQDAMRGIYTTTATRDTIDEAPSAYKDKDVIVKAVAETVDIEFFMKPVYNFKAGAD
jgi:tRNA-splicing ligase RtcB